MLKTIIKTVLLGREKGFRRKIFSQFMGNEDTSPNAAYSAPEEDYVGVVYGGSNKMEPPKDVNPPDGFEVVLHRDALAVGEITEVIIAGIAIAVANIDGEIHALSNNCPHAGGPLAEGALEGSILSCPYHGWGFDITTGDCQTNPDHSVELYETYIEGDAICVRLS